MKIWIGIDIKASFICVFNIYGKSYLGVLLTRESFPKSSPSCNWQTVPYIRNEMKEKHRLDNGIVYFFAYIMLKFECILKKAIQSKIYSIYEYASWGS